MSARIEPTLLRKLNERRVLELIQKVGPSSRAKVTRLSGMSAPTVSKAIAALIEVGLLEETDAVVGAFGRPAKLVRLAATKACVMGVVIEPGQCWVVATGLDGKFDPLRSKNFPTPHTYPELMDRIVGEIEALRCDLSCEVYGVGISVPGLMHTRQQEVMFSPNLHMLNGHRPAEDLAGRTGLTCVALQESHALCVGERMFGNARDQDDFAMMDITSGLGLGVMSSGRYLSGQSGMAGELGHITIDPNGKLCGCGNRGCLETVATDAALARAISQRTGTTVEIEQAVELVKSGQIDLTEELNQIVDSLAIACGAVINLFNPTTLFIHGTLFSATPDLFQKVVDRTASHALAPSLAECRIVLARGSKRQGAVAGIIQHLTQSWAPTLT